MAEARFDPYPILQALEREHGNNILIGGLARVLRGSDELTYGLDPTPRPRPENLRRLEAALASIGARPVRGGEVSLERHDFSVEPVLALASEDGDIKGSTHPRPARAATRTSIVAPAGSTWATGSVPRSPRPATSSASSGCSGEREDSLRIETMQRVVELDHGLGLEL